MHALSYLDFNLPLPNVGIVAAIVASLTLITSLAARIKTPSGYISRVALLVYILLVGTMATLALTGEPSGMVVGLVSLVLFGAGIFGVFGIATGTLLVAILISMVFLGAGKAGSDYIGLLIAGVIPLVIGAIIWSRDENPDLSMTPEDKSYSELATKLGQVSGKSDAVINAIDDGVIALNGKGVIELINPAAQSIIGWENHDAISLSYKSVLKLVDEKGDELDDMSDPVAQVLANNTRQSTDDFSLITGSNKRIVVSMVISPVGQNGSGAIIVFRDVTKEKAEERQQAEFISTASHEMRTPVASIEGYLGLVLNPATATIDEKARDFVTKAHAAAQHLGRLFQDLLDISKSEDGRLKNNPQVVDVSPFVKDVFEGLEQQATEKGLRFIFKPEPDNETVSNHRAHGVARSITPVFFANVDNDHLREVVGNLIENAIKYTAKGEVTVDVGGDEAKITISISDTGIGIPKEDIPHLFQKFYRVDNTETREIGGTGLGLYLCRRLAEAMSGRIWAESELGQGSTFHLEIPRINHNEATKLIEEASVLSSDTGNTPTTETSQTPESSTTPQPAVEPQAYQSRPTLDPTVLAPPIYRTPETLSQPRPSPENQHQLRPNTPLSAIEANPNQYTRIGNAGVPVPPRQE